MRTRLIFIEASIEKVPEIIWGHPSVVSDSKRRRRHPSKILLYLPIHYMALKEYNLPVTKRGRPDILHRSLITALDSVLNKEKSLEIYVHTQQNILIKIDPSVRLPLDYYRFEGLMIQLLEKRKIPPNKKKALMKIEDISLIDFLKKDSRDIYLLSREGDKLNKKIALGMLGNNILIGAFQNGEISKEIIKEVNHVVSISSYTHMSSTVTCFILTYLQNIKNDNNLT